MFQFKPIGWFLVRFLVVFGVLIAPWLGIGRGYAVVFRAGGNVFFGSFGWGGRGSASFEPLTRDDIPDRDTKIKLTNRKTGAYRVIAGNSRFQGYVPTAFTVALVLATPFPWLRKLRTLLLMLVVVMVGYVALRQYVFLVYESCQRPVVLYDPGPWVAKVLDFGRWVFVTSYAGVFAIPLGIWILVSFRRADLEKILKTTIGEKSM